jgi:hypothetical protein
VINAFLFEDELKAPFYDQVDRHTPAYLFGSPARQAKDGFFQVLAEVIATTQDRRSIG